VGGKLLTKRKKQTLAKAGEKALRTQSSVQGKENQNYLPSGVGEKGADTAFRLGWQSAQNERVRGGGCAQWKKERKTRGRKVKVKAKWVEASERSGINLSNTASSGGGKGNRRRAKNPLGFRRDV